MILFFLMMTGVAAAQQSPVREWPSQQSSQQSGTLDQGDDPPMGAGGNCRLNGERIPQGETQCLDVHGERFIATCGRVLNNTSWLMSDEPCGA